MGNFSSAATAASQNRTRASRPWRANRPRAIVEPPVDSEYCPARRALQSQLARHGITLDAHHGGELATPLPVEVIGLAFHDFNHDRPLPFATNWELHPAIVTLLR